LTTTGIAIRQAAILGLCSEETISVRDGIPFCSEHLLVCFVARLIGRLAGVPRVMWLVQAAVATVAKTDQTAASDRRVRDAAFFCLADYARWGLFGTAGHSLRCAGILHGTFVWQAGDELDTDDCAFRAHASFLNLDQVGTTGHHATCFAKAEVLAELCTEVQDSCSKRAPEGLPAAFQEPPS
jgi:hypothetical protein